MSDKIFYFRNGGFELSFKYKHIGVVLAGCLLTASLSGCSQDNIYNIFSGKNDADQKTAAEQLAEQGISTDNESLITEQNEEEFEHLSDAELTALLDKIISFHTTSDKKVEDFEELREDFNLYAKNIITSTQAEESLVKLQQTMDDSKFRLYDTDGDGVSDFMEICVTNTSPLLESTDLEKKDSQYKYNAKFIVFIDKSGVVRTINPELSSVVLDSINNGVISPLEGQYAIVEARVYGSDIDSLRVATDTDAKSDSSLQQVAYLYPITIRLVGPSGTTLDGTITYMHKNYTPQTKEKSVIFIYGGSSSSTSMLDYLQRTPTSTSTSSQGKIYLEKYYKLLFPKKPGVSIVVSESSAQ